MNDLNLDDIFNRCSITNRAREDWNVKDDKKKIKSGNKYHHIFFRYNYELYDWRNHFDELSQKQQNILIKGELIRTYDSLPIKDKVIIRDELKLNDFCTKWFKLSSEDKTKLLKHIIYNDDK